MSTGLSVSHLEFNRNKISNNRQWYILFHNTRANVGVFDVLRVLDRELFRDIFQTWCANGFKFLQSIIFE